MTPEHRVDDLVDCLGADGTRETYADAGTTDPIARFGLRMMPFSDCVNPELFFRTEAHDHAFTEMRRCIEEHVSLGLCTAPSGTGKTLLTQILLGSLDPRKYRAVLALVYPGMTQAAMLRELVGELGLGERVGPRAKLHDLVSAVHDEIIRLYQQGIKLVAIIDEVHFLRADCLHVLRTLSNIEAPDRKLVTALLFGEESFLRKMDHPSFQSLFSRMFVRVGLRPLTTPEIEQYVKYRLLMAGGRPALFAPECYATLAERSRGVPREINRLCSAALRAAAQRGGAGVGPRDFVVQDL